jgi:tellurite resistance protein TerC
LDVTIWTWLALVAAIAVALALDLFVFHRHAHTVALREALVATGLWVALGLAAGLVVLAAGGSEAAGQYYAGYVIEKALSVENIFVIALVIGAFAVPRPLQHRVLFLGVIGALVLRGGFVAAGAALLETFHWAVYVFGFVLVGSGIKMLRHRAGDVVDPRRNPALRVLRRIVPVTDDYDGQRFFVRRAGVVMATPMLAVLTVIETTDVVFAVDSIPAVFAVTEEPFLVFASTAFAMLGMRALYFVLADVMDRFVHLKTALAVVLAFVGMKMLLTGIVHIPVTVSLAVIVTILTVALVASLRATAGRDDSPEPALSGRSRLP